MCLTTCNCLLVEVIACGIPKSEFEKDWNFHEWPTKSHIEFPAVIFFGLRISKGCSIFLWNCTSLWACLFSRMSKINLFLSLLKIISVKDYIQNIILFFVSQQFACNKSLFFLNRVTYTIFDILKEVDWTLLQTSADEICTILSHIVKI